MQIRFYINRILFTGNKIYNYKYFQFINAIKRTLFIIDLITQANKNIFYKTFSTNSPKYYVFSRAETEFLHLFYFLKKPFHLFTHITHVLKKKNQDGCARSGL